MKKYTDGEKVYTLIDMVLADENGIRKTVTPLELTETMTDYVMTPQEAEIERLKGIIAEKDLIIKGSKVPSATESLIQDEAAPVSKKSPGVAVNAKPRKTRTVLNPFQKVELEDAFKSGKTTAQIVKKFNISEATVSRKRNEFWERHKN